MILAYGTLNTLYALENKVLPLIVIKFSVFCIESVTTCYLWKYEVIASLIYISFGLFIIFLGIEFWII